MPLKNLRPTSDLLADGGGGGGVVETRVKRTG